MKILTGKWRGRRIVFHPREDLRPTADKARKAVFDMFQGEMEGRRVLDLFSGTGAIGLEALSQGAAHATFVERDRAQCRDISQNLENLGASSQAEVKCGDAFAVLSHLAGGQRYDFVFVDPPYDDGSAAAIVEDLSKAGLVAPAGFVLVECRKKHDLPEKIGLLRLVRDKRYGQTKVLIYRS